MRVSDLKPGEPFKLATDARVFKRVTAEPDPQTGLCEATTEQPISLHPDLYAEPVQVECPTSALGRVTFHDDRIELHLAGYGRKDGGPIVVIDIVDRRPVLSAWGEIDNPDFTHRVTLAGAKVPTG